MKSNLQNFQASKTNHFRQAGMTLIAVGALALTAGSSWAQTSSSGSAGAPSTANSPGITSTGTPGMTSSNMGSNNMANGSKVVRADSKMLSDIAQANLAEIATGQLALEKSQNADVKKFAQQMVDDHSAALKDVQTVAADKGVTLPDGPDLTHKTMATTMKALSGNSFDSQYIKHAGVGDHEKTAALLKKTQKDAKDSDVKALASKMLPTVQKHLAMARQMATMAANNKGA